MSERERECVSVETLIYSQKGLFRAIPSRKRDYFHSNGTLFQSTTTEVVIINIRPQRMTCLKQLYSGGHSPAKSVLSRAHTHVRTRACSHTHTYARARACTHTHTCALHTQARQTQTHTHMHALHTQARETHTRKHGKRKHTCTPCTRKHGKHTHTHLMS